jgi:hypothetical protein
MMMNTEVSIFLDSLKHPLRSEIESLRKIILKSDAKLEENIKWNAPNYSLNEQDRFTLRILPVKNNVQIILHRGAKKQQPLGQKLIETDFKGLVWKENDRAILTFSEATAIEKAEAELVNVLKLWLEKA